MNRFSKLLSLFVFTLLICTGHSALTKPMRKPWSAEAIRAYNCSRADSLHGFDVQKYVITLAIDDVQRSVNGDVLATVLATEALSSIQYELEDLTVSQVKVNGTNSTFTHTDGIINIPLNIAAGQEFTTQVFYSGNPQPSQDFYRVGMLFGNNSVHTLSVPDAGRRWWPCYDHPWDKAVVDLHITMRSDWKVAANGLRDSIVFNGDGTSTTHWLGHHPMTTYLVCITAGPYVEIHQAAGNVPIINFVTQELYNNAQNVLASLPDMILYYSQLFGDYPFEKYGNATANMSAFAAMEHQTMTTLSSHLLWGTNWQELIIAHELAHQWFGNAVSFLNYTDVWLSEGFATYSEHLWVDKISGWQAACDYVANDYHRYYTNWENSYGITVIYDPPFNDYYSPAVYEKAASVLHMLRLKMGDQAFFNLLQTWVETYKYQNAVTAEFQAMAEQISGQDLDQFFDQWIFGAGIPSVEYSIWNNPDSDSPGKIIARTISPTATQFVVDIPFRVTLDSVSDSLVAIAGPTWTVNHYSQSLPLEAEISANHNSWTLLNGLTCLQPEITSCLSSNGAVYLSWNTFMDEEAYNYNIYRKQAGSDAWILVNDHPLPGCSYLDIDVQHNISYEYVLCAVDAYGWRSSASNPVDAQPLQFSFAYPLLVVDETQDGSGDSPIMPTDEMVDDFYHDALQPRSYVQWDCATQDLPPLSTLGEYQIVLWHADDMSHHLLRNYQDTLCGYIIGGGKVILSGWKIPNVLSQSFLDLVAGSVTPVYQNAAVFAGAESQSYPAISVDSSKMLSPWNGMLPYSYSFQNAEIPLYTDVDSGNCVIFMADHQFGAGNLIMSGVPFYYMQASGVRGFLQQIISELEDTGNDDPVQKPQQIALHAYPNPFNPECIISFQLPEAGKATLTLYNIRGQKVKTIANQDYESGAHKVTLDASNLPSGVYTIRIKSGAHTQTRRITLMK